MTPDQQRVLFSSATAEWGTPPTLVAAIARRLGVKFQLDVCATPANAKALAFFTKEQDCFTKAWEGHWWCNPVYGNPRQACAPDCAKKGCAKKGHAQAYQPGCIDFVHYGIGELFRRGHSGTYLVPARVDTRWFELLFKQSATVLFIKGRVPFLNAQGVALDPAPFPSAVMHIVANPPAQPAVEIWRP